MVRSLLTGHTRYLEHIGQEREFLSGLSGNQQQPSALFIGCSDSRVIPEVLTQARPGELFVVRNVANVVPGFDDEGASVGAALDFAIGVLGVRHVIVCGHYGCGGVLGAIDGLEHLAHAPSLQGWLQSVVPAVHDARGLAPHADREALWRLAVERNVMHQLVRLTTYPVVADALTEDRLELHGWIYDLYSLGMLVFDSDTDGFLPAREVLLRSS